MTEAQSLPLAIAVEGVNRNDFKILKETFEGSTMLKLTGRRSWPSRLQPVGESTLEKEPFSTWYARNKAGLEHLDPRILEQWVYKHWIYSPYTGLPLDTLTSTIEIWKSSKLIAEVGFIDEINVITRGDELGGSDGVEFLARFVHRDGRTFEPGTTMSSTGTWNFPILVIESPGGFWVNGFDFPSWRYWLIEGHLRFRYLRALHVAGLPDRDHEVLFVRYPEPFVRRRTWTGVKPGG